MKKTTLFTLFLFFTLICQSLWAQHRGAVEVGGAFSFRNKSLSNQKINNLANLTGLMGYYINQDFLLEFEPKIEMTFNSDSTGISTIFLLGPAFKVIDMAPKNYRKPRYRKYDLGVVAAVFTTFSAGVWLNGKSDGANESESVLGAAFAAAIATHSSFGKRTILRVKAQYVHLMPSGNISEAQNIFEIGVGFSVFVR